MKTYMLVAVEKENKSAFESPEDRQKFMSVFAEWTEDLTRKNQFIRADQLPLKFKRVEQKASDFKVTDGPYTETKELLTGYFLIKAESMSHATEIAKKCPVLRFDNLDIYEIGE